MPFDIKFLPPVMEGSQLGNAALPGRIVLGEYEEDFISLIGFWSPMDYEHQWQAAIERLVETRQASCLITSFHDPNASDVARWWLLYPDQHVVHVQEALLLLSGLPARMSTHDLYKAILPRETRNYDGLPISEWDVPLQDFFKFLGYY